MEALSAEKVISKAKERSARAISELASKVEEELRDDVRLLDTTTLFVTGSAARGEMSEHSDLDVFVVRLDGEESRLDDAIITSAITRALRAIQKPKPSQDGRFLKMQLARDLVGELGTEKDDFHNHFTARMLLLLESRPLLAPALHRRLVSQVIDRYWEDAQAHQGDHLPYLLINDVVRYWRILLLNYASRVAGKDAEEADRRLQSYKLRFSRCLTCFSALTHLTAEFRARPNIRKDFAQRLTEMSPLERLDAVVDLEPARSERVERIKRLYAGFLETTAAPKETLIERFRDKDYRKERSKESRAFGDEVFHLMRELGEGPGEQMLRITVV